MLFSLFIVSVLILVVSEVVEGKQKKIRGQNMTFKKNLHVKKY